MNNSRIPRLMNFLKNNFIPRSQRVLNLVSIFGLVSSIVIFYLIIPILFNTSLRHPVLKYGAEKYTDVIVGRTTWSDFYKSFDYIAVYLFLLIFFFIWFFSVFLINRLPSTYQTVKREQIIDKVNALSSFVVIGCLAYTIGLWLMTRTFPLVEVTTTCIIAAIWLVLKLKSQAAPYPQILYESSNRFVSFLLGIFFTFFSVIGIIGAVKLVDPNFLISDISAAKAIVFFSVLLVAIIGLFMLLTNSKVLNKQWARFAFSAQLFTPLLLTIFVHGIYQQNDTMVRINVPFSTTFLIALISLLAISYNLRELIKATNFKNFPSIDRLILRTSVISISCFLAYKIPAYSPFTLDDFHLGEAMLPWNQIFHYHQTIYNGFLPVHGLMDVLYSGINSIMFYGTASSFPPANSFFPIVVAGLTSYLLCRLAGNAWGLAFSIVLFPLSNRFFFVLPVILILALPGLVSRPIMWIASWIILSIIHVFYIPSAGTALTVASLPFAGIMIYETITKTDYKDIWLNNWKKGLVLIVIIFVLIWFSAPSVTGLLEFIRDNGSVIAIARGIGLFQYGGVPHWFPWQNIYLWTGFRIGGWFFGALVLWYLFNRNLIKQNGQIKDNFLKPGSIVSLIGMIFLIALTPYSMGRIDPNELSRTGCVSLLVIGTILPLAIVLCTDLRRRPLMPVAIIGILLGVKSSFTLGYSIRYESPGYWAQQAVKTISVPSDAQFIRGDKIDLPNLGGIFIRPAKLDQIRKLKRLTDTFLKDGETYFDLTNRSVYYFILDKKPPTSYLSDYNTPSYELQEKMIDGLKKTNPPVVWIGPRISHDGGPASLRSYRIYRWLMKQNYRYYEQDGFSFLIRKDRYSELGLNHLSKKSNLDGLSKTFHQKELQSIPISWGRNVNNLMHRFKDANSNIVPVFYHNIVNDDNGWLRVVGSDPYVVWKLAPHIDGGEYDFLLISLECHQKNNPLFRGEVFWADHDNKFSDDRSFNFNIKSGKLLIPLGSHPDWLKSTQIKRLRFDIDEFDKCPVFRFGPIKFMSLIK
jgi:hypothetical protein